MTNENETDAKHDRLDCLRMAVAQGAYHTHAMVVEAARAYYDFITGRVMITADEGEIEGPT